MSKRSNLAPVHPTAALDIALRMRAHARNEFPEWYSEEYLNRTDRGEAVPTCDCTDFPDESVANPLCQASDGNYGLTQYFGKAYPSLRELRVLERYGRNSIVSSICPKETSVAADDYGYRPAVAAMIERFSEVLAPQ